MMTAMVQCMHITSLRCKSVRQEIKPCRRRSVPHLSGPILDASDYDDVGDDEGGETQTGLTLPSRIPILSIAV